jgi:transposase
MPDGAERQEGADESSVSALRRPRRAQEPALAKAGDTVVACVRHMVNGTVKREVRTFKTTTTELLALSDWLAAEKCTHLVMEATGVYWKPVWHILSDADFSLVLANAAHVKNVPGRKTDVNDATWLADLLAHGLIRGSFVPDQQTQEMRDLLRTRKQLTRERSRHVQRLQKTLEDANIKLASEISDIIGLTGRKMIEALDRWRERSRAAGPVGASPHQGHARGASRSAARPRHPPSPLPIAPASATDRRHRQGDQRHRSGGRRSGRALSYHRPPPDHHSRRRQTERMRHPRRNRPRHEPPPDRRAPDLLGRTVSEKRRECGQAALDPDAQGAAWLKTTLVQCAAAAARRKASYLQAQFHRLRARRGAKKAIGALAASILTIAYHMLLGGELYHDLGPDHFDRRAKPTHIKRLVTRLQNLGYAVQITALQREPQSVSF